MKFASRNATHVVDLLFTLALFCVFAATALMVVLIGARVYQNTVEGMNQNFDGRASLSYVTNKIRQNDGAGAVRTLLLEDGTPAIGLYQEVEEVGYLTYIYHYDGAIREVFAEEGFSFLPENGQVIVEVESFDFTQVADSLYQLVAVDQGGNRVETRVAVRSA